MQVLKKMEMNLLDAVMDFTNQLTGIEAAIIGVTNQEELAAILSKFNSPKGKSSLQAEIFIDNKVKITNDYIESVKKNTIENLVRIGIFKKKDLEVVNVKFLKYANVIFDKNCSKNRTLIFDYFKKYNVDFVGRFGKWAYLWSDDCFLAGKLTAEKIYKNLNEINIKR